LHHGNSTIALSKGVARINHDVIHFRTGPLSTRRAAAFALTDPAPGGAGSR